MSMMEKRWIPTRSSDAMGLFLSKGLCDQVYIVTLLREEDETSLWCDAEGQGFWGFFASHQNGKDNKTWHLSKTDLWL